MSAEQDIRRADQAKAIVEHELVREAFAAIEAEIVAEWRNAPVRDQDARERLWLMLRMLDKFRGHFAGLIETGTLAKARLAEIEKEKKFNLWPRRAV